MVVNPFSFFSPFSNSSIGDTVLSPMVGCEHPPLYLSGSDRASQQTAVSGFCQQALLGIHNCVWVWWLYMGGIPWKAVSGWPCLQSLLHTFPVSPSVDILFPSKKEWSIHTLVFLLLEQFSLWIVSWVVWASGLISTYQWVHIMCGPLWLVYLTQDDILQIHPFA